MLWQFPGGKEDGKPRKLTLDFVEAPSRTQPSALETMKPVSGVTLRQGGNSRVGPPKAPGEGPAQLSRQDFKKTAAQQAATKARQLATPANKPAVKLPSAHSTPLPAPTQRPDGMAAGGKVPQPAADAGMQRFNQGNVVVRQAGVSVKLELRITSTQEDWS